LEKAGYRVVEAEAFQKIFALLEKDKIDLALVSEHLPKDGEVYETKPKEILLLSLLRDHTLAIMKLIILTCNAPDCSMKGLRADRFLRKPFNPRELIRLIKELLPDPPS
jgi:DNA-binding response OmpR family regulator